MRIAAAFAAADRSNKFLSLDDVGTPFHSPARDQNPRQPSNLAKRAELGRHIGPLWKKPVYNWWLIGKDSLPLPGFRQTQIGIALPMFMAGRCKRAVRSENITLHGHGL
jgi:hypothetical protein